MRGRGLAFLALPMCCLACEQCVPVPAPTWSMARETEPGALLSIRERDGAVWTVGGDPDGVEGPAFATLLVDHDPSDDGGFVAYDANLQGDLWWVDPVSADVAYVSGSFGRVARIDISSGAAVVEELTTPVTGQDNEALIVFGVLATGDDVWAAGGRIGGLTGGFVWRSQGGGPMEAVALPTATVDYVMWKAAARGPDDVWLVGTKGRTFHWDGAALTEVAFDEESSLFTVALDDEGAVAVGGPYQGRILARGRDDAAPWQEVTPAGASMPSFFGVHLRGDEGLVVGQSGMVLTRQQGAFVGEELGFPMFVTLHGCFIGEDGSYWAVGGSIDTLPLTGGVLLRRSP